MLVVSASCFVPWLSSSCFNYNSFCNNCPHIDSSMNCAQTIHQFEHQTKQSYEKNDKIFKSVNTKCYHDQCFPSTN